MTHERDIERLLDHWLSDGPTEAPNRVLDVVADRIDRRSQRPAWRLDWRTISVNRTIGAVAAVAAIIVIAVVGFSLLGGRSGSSIGGPATSPTASPTAAPPSASPTAAAASPSPSVAIGVPGACDLMTAVEATSALHISAAITVESVGSSGPTAPSRYCAYHTADDTQGVVLSYETESGVATFAAWKSNPGNQPVAGLGDGAVWDPTQKTLYILKGSRLVAITAGDAAPPLTLKTAQAIGTIVLGRM